MCQQCETEALTYGQPIPGWHLMKSVKDHPRWRAGHWGLVRSNDPCVTWSFDPIIDPIEVIETSLRERGLRPKQVDKRVEMIPEDHLFFASWDNFHSRANAFKDKVEASLGLDASYELVLACGKTGYRRKTDGDAAYWLFNRLGMWLAADGRSVHHSKSGRKFKRLIASRLIKSLELDKMVDREVLI